MANSTDSALGCLGIATDRTDTSAEHDQGLEVVTQDGRAVYARAAAATPAGSLVRVAPSSATANGSTVATLVSTGTINTGGVLAVANVSVAVSSYGWFYTESRNPGAGLEIRVATACQPNVPLYTTGTGGVVDDATVSGGNLLGIKVLESAASASTVPAIFHDIVPFAQIS